MYEEKTAVPVNITETIVNKEIIHNNRFPSEKDVYRVYTNHSFDISLKDNCRDLSVAKTFDFEFVLTNLTYTALVDRTNATVTFNPSDVK